jgi:Tol biopolymer transport system component
MEIQGTSRNLWPHFLPDGKRFLYTATTGDANTDRIYISSIDSQQPPREVIRAASRARFIAPHYILYVAGGNLLAQTMNMRTLERVGEPIPVSNSVDPVALGAFSASATGTVAYLPGVGRVTRLIWYDMQGRKLGSVGEQREILQATLSPDGRRVAVSTHRPYTQEDDLWLLELSTAALSRFSAANGTVDAGVWSPDGRQVAYASNSGRGCTIFRKIVGSGEGRPAFQSNDRCYPEAWLSDDSMIVLDRNGRTFYRLPAGADPKPEVLLQTEYDKDTPRVSPDGGWISYNTNESGRWEVYIATYPAFNQRRQVSTNGGVQGYWHKDGRTLYYLALDGTMMSVPVKLASPPETGVPAALFRTQATVSPTDDQFAVAADGRFLVIEPEDTGSMTFNVIVNWPSSIRP